MIWRLILLAIVITGCGPSAIDNDSVLVVMCSDPIPDPDSQDPQHHPCCTAFALAGQVVTANHCVPGETAELVTSRQWTRTSNASEIGTVTARDEARDIAWLSAALDGPGLTQGGAAREGDAVQALTRSGSKPGRVGSQTGVFWLSTMDTRFSDSGSAVVDSGGAAIGVVSQCLTADDKQCDPNSAIFSELP